MHKKLFLLILLFTAPSVHAQSLFKSFWQLSGPEKFWSITHPFIVGKAGKISRESKILSVEMVKDTSLDGDPAGGQVDAFRHSYWMARLAQTFCWKEAIRLGKAHEKGNYRYFKKGKKDDEGVLPDSMASVMDLFNNQVGVEIGCNNRNADKEKLKQIIMQQILGGKMKVIAKNKAGMPVDCDGNVIDINSQINNWYIPKCLVTSGP